MRIVLLIFTLFCLFLSCNRKGEVRSKMEEAEQLLQTGQPDSAFSLLDNVVNPDVLDDRTFAHFCMLYAELSEKVGEDMPFVPQMERATYYYMRYGTPEEKIKIQQYLGLSYEEETDYEWAMKAYLGAAEIAKEEESSLVLGKLYSKIAQLHDFDDNFEEAEHYHRLSGEYYLKGNDSVNYIYSIRDLGWTQLLKGNYNEALQSVEKAYQLALPMNDSLMLSSMTNRLGIIYEGMGDYVLAEKFLSQSVSYDKDDSTPTYLALADLYSREGRYGKARVYIEKATINKNERSPLTSGILYQLYILEKESGNYDLALDYYERYSNFRDSISKLKEEMNILKVEKRYKYAELLNQNTVLELRYSRVIVIGISLGLVLLISVYIYFEWQKRKMERLKREQELATKSLQEKEFELQGLSEKVKDIRENILEDTPIYKRVMQNALSIEESRKNPFTDKDWQSLYGAIKTTYPFFKQNMENRFPNLTEEEKHFCCLLKLGLGNQQLAFFLRIQAPSVDRRRYRIRKKGNLENTKTTLEEIIANL